MDAGVQRWWRDRTRFERETRATYVRASGSLSNGHRWTLWVDEYGRLCTVVYAPGSITYCDGI